MKTQPDPRLLIHLRRLAALLTVALVLAPQWASAQTPASPDPSPAEEKQASEGDDEDIEVEDIEVEDIEVEEDGDVEGEDLYVLPDVIVSYKPEDIARIGGSAHLIEEKALEAFEFDDPNSILLQAPGVYLRQEDGYGLRPNIGLRGASSDRSKKVTLMEDGILFAPAPYSAPAAYYFPLMTRMKSVEIFKGPAAIQYGPNTIGGAINLLTRDIPRKPAAMIDMAYGTDAYTKLHGQAGTSNKWGGLLFEGVVLHSDGFKELDGDGNTGFLKGEFMLKSMLQSDPLGDTYHRGDLKLGYSTEDSNETYLGLTDADFALHPNRRYRASALDHMSNERTQIELRYTLAMGESFDLYLKGYHQTFWRSWRKLNRFRGGPSLSDILHAPDSGERAVYYGILKGEEDSFSDAQTLMIGANTRAFVSRGVQLTGHASFETGPIEHDLKLGLRLHHDRIRRHHSEDPYVMEAGELIADGAETEVTKRNLGSTVAFAGHLMYSLQGFGFTLSPGMRTELIYTEHEDYELPETQQGDQQVALLGIGAHYAITQELGVLAGVHQGFSPVSPGQPEEVQPEQSLNYEFGLRYSDPNRDTLLEAVGFFNHYSNLIGECSFSAGCRADQLDRQANAGEVHVLGLETVLGHRFELGGGYGLPTKLSYTFTQTAFQTDFTSENPLFGEVEKGDELPYVPSHQLSFQVALDHSRWGLAVNGTLVDGMREVAGKETTDDEPLTDLLFMVDMMMTYRPAEVLEFYLKANNLFMQRPVAARHPFGARPGKPFTVLAGVKLHL